jgi:hypothetical protein
MMILNIVAASVGILIWAPSVACNGYVFSRQVRGIFWGVSPIPIAGSIAGCIAVKISSLPISIATVLLGILPDILWFLGMMGGALHSRLFGTRTPPWETESNKSLDANT